MSVGFPLPLLTAIWLLGIDGPHVTGTVTRTYFDKHERRRLGWLLWALIPLLFIGPLAVMVGQGALFFLFAICWQHYHITKQHVGFVHAVESQESGTRCGRDEIGPLVRAGFGCHPAALFVVRTRLAPGTLMNVVTISAIAAFGVLTVIYTAFEIRKWRAGRPMNVPKLLLLAGVVPLQWLAFGYAATFGPDGITRAGIALGLFHSLQYHRLMWFHNKNRYQVEGFARKTRIGCGAGPEIRILFSPPRSDYWIADILPQAIFPVQWLQASLWGIAFMHYLLDSKIWRVRGDKELAAALHL